MGVISTTTVLDSLRYPSESQIDRYTTGTLYFLKRDSSTQCTLYYSNNNGTSWTADASFTRSNLQEVSGIFIDGENNISVAYRVYESGEDRIYYRRIKSTDSNWRSELLVASATAASAGSVYTGCSVVNFKLSSTIYVFFAIGTRNGTNSGVTLFAATINSSDTFTVKNTLIDGYRQWLNGPDGVVHPALDFKHTGNAKSVGSGPALWVAWGRGTLYCIKASWQSGPTWYGPWTPTTVATGLTNQDHNVGRYNGYGDKFHIAIPNGNTVTVIERKVDDSGGTARNCPNAHPQGNTRYVALSNSATSNSYRVYAVGTSNPDLYYVDYNAAGASWGSWTLVTATDIVGTVPNNFSVRRNNYGNGQYDLAIAGGSTPYTLTHTSSTSASAPKTPVITSPENGSANDVAQTLTLQWTFTDDDPLDSQSAYAIRRVIGASTTYWNNGTSSWQGSEVFNTSSTTSKAFSSGWGADSDAVHFYSVRVRDQSSLTSGYSNSVMVIPSAKNNPTITSPGASVTTPNISASWTVSSQSAYRLVLKASGTSVYDSGWVDSTSTSAAIPYTLVNGGSYSVELTTRNAEGLQSNTVTQAFTATFTPPAAASLVLTPLAAQGIIRVGIVNPEGVGSVPGAVSNTLYRRKVGESGNGVKVAELSPTRVNMLNVNDANIETNIGNWQSNNSGVATITRSTAQALDGVASAALTQVTTGPMPGAYLTPYPNGYPAVAGETYTFYYWARAASTVRSQRARLFWFSGPAGAVNNGTINGASAVDSNSGWTKFEITGVAPAGTTFLIPAILSSADNAATAVSEVHYADRMWLGKTSDLNLIGTIPNPGSAVTYDDFTVASGVEYEYRVMTVATNGAASYSSWVA